MNLSVLIVTIQ